MKILLTGASGFLGSVIQATLANDTIVALNRSNGAINVDLAKTIPILPKVETVVHAAGRAHVVATSETDSQEFFNTNVKGTMNLLKGLEQSVIPKSFIFISSVAVYGREDGLLLDEDEPLLAIDPYGASKIEAEKIILEWCRQNSVIAGILRVPLIVGPNPPGNLKSMINGIKKGFYFNIDGGQARKSMVLARDIARIIPIVSKIGGTYNLTDGYHPSFVELSTRIAKKLNKPNPRNLPLSAARLAAKIGDIFGPRVPVNSIKLNKIISTLTFDDSRARTCLAWKPQPVLDNIEL